MRPVPRSVPRSVPQLVDAAASLLTALLLTAGLLTGGVGGVAAAAPPAEPGGPATWDGRHSLATIRATVVYFVPADRRPLDDWRERVEWLCDRMRRFHAREAAGRSRLETVIHPEPFRSALDTAAIRSGNADATFFRTLTEVDTAIDVGRDSGDAFPVLLVLSDVNWRPLDDFSRLAPDGDGWRFDGAIDEQGIHVPGAAAGGSRAVYLADRGRGWGLVSGDGWRVPCRGSDCVAYHEGIGHAVGLPHPAEDDGSVMSLGQYRHALSQSWIEEGQKRRIGFLPADPAENPAGNPAENPAGNPAGAPECDPAFDRFTAVPEPAVPRPGETVRLRLGGLDAAAGAPRVEIQTSLRGPWTRVAVTTEATGEGLVPLGAFDRPGGVAYRASVRGADGSMAASAWGYFQVRREPGIVPPPGEVDPTDHAGAVPSPPPAPASVIDLLALADPGRDAVAGRWRREEREGGGVIVADKDFGARLEIPFRPPEAYRLTVIAEPLDEPHGLTLGLRAGGRRFLVLLGFAAEGGRASALENVDGRNVADNPTRFVGDLFARHRPAEIVCTVLPGRVRVTVDGHDVIDFRGDAERLSLGDYWRTPREEALFLGAYDCGYRFLRATLEPLAGEGGVLDAPAAPPGR